MMKKQNGLNVVLLITFCTILGKALGIVRDSMISYYYGATAETDAFFLAMSIPTIILGVFTASTDSAIIPQYTRVMKQQSREEADNLFSVIINRLSLLAIFSGVLIFFFPSFFIDIFASGFDKRTAAVAMQFLRIFSPIGLLHLWYCFFCTYNAAYRKNIIRSILAFLNNVILVFALLISKNSGLQYLALAYLVINLVCALLPIIEMKQAGYKHRFRTDTTNGEFKKFIHIFIPIMGGALLNDVQQYVDKNLSSSIPGGISYLNYGDKLVNIFDSILVVGLAVVILPLLSEFESDKEYKKMSAVSSRVTRMMLAVLVPCMTVLLVCGEELITLLFGRGKFDSKAIHVVTSVLLAYAPLIVIIPMTTIFSKFFSAKEMNHLPFRINLFGVLLNTILSILLKIKYGVVGVAAATTIAMSIEIFIYCYFIEKHIRWDKAELNIRHEIGILLPTSILLVFNFAVPLRAGLIMQICIESVCITFVYLLFYWIFLKEDVYFFINRLKKEHANE